MAKKSQKQPKRTPPTPNDNSAPNAVTISTPNTTEVTPEAVATLAALTEPTTREKFKKFVEIADVSAIKTLLNAAAYRSPESEIFEDIWVRAYDEGYVKGRDNWMKQAEVNYQEGYQEGLQEGKRDACRSFKRLLERERDEEHSKWVAAGHGARCFAVVAILEDTGTQTEPSGQPQPQTLPHFETSTQTSPPTPTHDAGTQYEPPPVILDATPSDEPQLVAAASPTPTLIAYEEITTPGTILSTTITIDTPITSTPVDFISNTPKFVGSPPKTTKSISPNPVLAPPAPQKNLSSSPLDMSTPSLPFTSKNNHKNFDWSNEPCNFNSGPPSTHSPPPAKFTPRDFSALRSGSGDPWKSIQDQKGRRQRYTNRRPRLRQFSYRPCPVCTSSFHHHHHLPPTAPAFPTNIPSLDWDRDPRLSDLGHALKALGWVRR